ncbi:polyamine aminopropyltransferase [Haliovirga abyssi]|uniref:Polyamine aminopropyltransferase n=1 Tax=Haliovirga abyssi TaxID=2996794 RepID=A0AAU9DQM5_9FUSO|nr:polyamine aminopropyltransferase [Haliovirga abyssi]BDU50788.1 spermidine synthase [Haliovirga abyssi]
MEFWFSEFHLPGLKYSLKVKECLYSGKSEYQRLDVFETEEFGRAFTLDGILMVTEKDEFVYHEMMAHLSSNIHPNPKRALVIGGGDGGTIRELARYDSFEEIHLCEIDKHVTDVCLEYFPNVAGILKSDERVKLYFEDGIKFLENKKNYYDIICIDSTDPIGPAVGLFKEDFYKLCYESLTEDGIVIAQSESPWYHLPIIKDVQDSFRKIFPISKLATASLLAYQSGFWSFSIGSKRYNPIEDFNLEKAEKIEKFTKYYNSGIHKASFVLPNYVKKIFR